MSADTLRKMASISGGATAALEKVIEPMLSTSPSTLGLSHSAYYIGDAKITRDEIASIARVMEKNALEPENTRIRKSIEGDKIISDVLQASAMTNDALAIHLKGSANPIKILQQRDADGLIRLERGDHSEEMTKICENLLKTLCFSANETQTRFIMDYLESFNTGSLEAYRRSMKGWVKDYYPKVESIFGFIEPYRDPYGVRCEWRAVISIADPQQTAKLAALVDKSTKFIRTLPWAVTDINDGKGPFEKNEFQAPDFSVVHGKLLTLKLDWLVG